MYQVRTINSLIQPSMKEHIRWYLLILILLKLSHGQGVDYCALKTYDCPVNSICENKPHRCFCMCFPGFEGDGLRCHDVNECDLKTDNCSENAECLNLPGSYTCRCIHGFSGDGLTCRPTEKWVHICGFETKEVSCQEGAIFELTGVYVASRELGCPGDSTDPVSVIANCSTKHRYEDYIKMDIAKACNHTNACNITGSLVPWYRYFHQTGCGSRSLLTYFSARIMSCSYICTPGSSTAAPLTTGRPVTQSTVAFPKSTYPPDHSRSSTAALFTTPLFVTQSTVTVPKSTDPPDHSRSFTAALFTTPIIATQSTVTVPKSTDPPDHSSGYIAAAAIVGMIIGLVLGVTGMLFFRCRRGRNEDSTQSNDPQRNSTQEKRTVHYNVNSTDQSHQARPHSYLTKPDPNEDVNYEDIPEDIHLEDDRVYIELQSDKVYSELQRNVYVNGPDSSVYQGLKSQRS